MRLNLGIEVSAFTRFFYNFALLCFNCNKFVTIDVATCAAHVTPYIPLTVSDTILAKRIIINDIFTTFPFDYAHIFHN